MQRSRLFVLNNPNVLRLDPDLACEIGLQESVLLLQMEFWISISDNIRDGRRWTYQSVRDMQEKVFYFWSISTIQRAIQNLLDRNLLIEGSYNTLKYDRTRWFALGDAVRELQSVRFLDVNDTRYGRNGTQSEHDGTRMSQDGTRMSQDGTGLSPVGTTIPESTTETTTEITTEKQYPSPSGRRSVPTEYTQDFERFWSAYPRKQAKKATFGKWQARLKDTVNPVDAETLIQAATNYAEVCRVKVTGTNYTMLAETFLGPNERYLDYVDPECVEVAKREARRNRTSNKSGIDNGSYDYIPWAVEPGGYD